MRIQSRNHVDFHVLSYKWESELAINARDRGSPADQSEGQVPHGILDVHGLRPSMTSRLRAATRKPTGRRSQSNCAIARVEARTQGADAADRPDPDQPSNPSMKKCAVGHLLAQVMTRQTVGRNFGVRRVHARMTLGTGADQITLHI